MSYPSGGERKDFVKIGGLWKGKPGAKTVLQGEIEVGGEMARCWIFRNEYKKKETVPDFRLVVEEGSFGAKKGSRGGAPRPAAPPATSGGGDLEEFGL